MTNETQSVTLEDAVTGQREVFASGDTYSMLTFIAAHLQEIREGKQSCQITGSDSVAVACFQKERGREMSLNLHLNTTQREHKLDIPPEEQLHHG